MPITALPTPPTRQDPASFAARGDALLAALPVFANEANALRDDVNAKQALVAAVADMAKAALDAGVANVPALLSQTRDARDQALAGLGAADQSLNLVLLSDGLRMALDLAAQAAQWPITARETEVVLSSVRMALDLIGVIAGQVSGGQVQLAAGSAGEPSLSPATDRNTGMCFPAADVLALVTGGAYRLYVDATGRVGVGTSAPSGLLDINDNKIRVRSSQTPASATASGSAGEFCWDANYLYLCIATNTWKRAALTTW